MEKKKKKRGIAKATAVSIISPHHSNLYSNTMSVSTGKYFVPGAVFINISRKTQELIKCLREIDVTNEHPWVQVEKDAIEDNLFFYEETSDFYLVKDVIEIYPEKTILLGWIENSLSNDQNDFLVCLTVDAKNAILDIIKHEDEDRKRKATATFRMSVSMWISRGKIFSKIAYFLLYILFIRQTNLLHSIIKYLADCLSGRC